VSTLRPTLGPGSIGKYEHELTALDGLGLGEVDMDDCLTFVLAFVRSSARAEIGARAAREESGMDDELWWASAGPVLARVLDEEAYPLASRIGSAAGAQRGSAHDVEHAYRFGLARVLDGLATVIEG
jgi:Tetracyclin repressor-like, C-terminal domain